MSAIDGSGVARPTLEAGSAVSELGGQQESRPPHSCGRCQTRWAGSNTAHCAAQCHQTFTSPRSFDRHRLNGECRPPATVGLVAHERAGYTAWGFPMDDDARARLMASRTNREAA